MYIDKITNTEVSIEYLIAESLYLNYSELMINYNMNELVNKTNMQ